MDIQLISKYNEGFLSLLCVINIFSKYACVAPLKGTEGILFTNIFLKNLDESHRKSNEFC